MARAFQFTSTFNVDISLWDVSNVVNFFHMFSGTTVFNRDISLWNTTSAANLDGMVRFLKAPSLTKLTIPLHARFSFPERRTSTRIYVVGHPCCCPQQKPGECSPVLAVSLLPTQCWMELYGRDHSVAFVESHSWDNFSAQLLHPH